MNFDDILFNKQEDKEFNKEEWAQKKKERRDEAFQTANNMVDSISQDSHQFQQYLDIQSHFHQYTVTNALLIMAQRPDATMIKDSEKWRENKAYIKKNEVGFTILEPKPYQGEDGLEHVGYNPKSMFDVSQTTTRNIPKEPHYDMRTLIKAITYHMPIKLTPVKEVENNLQAFYSPKDNTIYIQQNLDGDMIFKSLSKELAHVSMNKEDSTYNRENTSFIAYCTSYMLCKAYDVDTKDFNFDKVPAYFENKQPEEVKEILTTLKDVFSDSNDRMRVSLLSKNEQAKNNPER